MNRDSVAKQYYEMKIPITGFDTDLLSGMLHREGCLGIQETESEEWIVYLPGEFPAQQVQRLLETLRHLNAGFKVEEVTFEKLPYRDWNEEWRKYFEPFEAVENCWIRPPWQKLPPDAAGEAIIIDPQMAFGTGHHETTRLMMQAMQNIALENQRVLDLGTGSGILALFARKAGAARVTAIDPDPDAIANALHNRKLNGIDQIDFQVGDITAVEGKTFPVILANIHFEPLFQIGLQLYHILEPGGRLVISGILTEDVSRLSYVYKQAGFLMEDLLKLNQWAAITWEKRA